MRAPHMRMRIRMLALACVCLALLSLLSVSGQNQFDSHASVPFCLPLSPTYPAAPFESGAATRVMSSWHEPLYAKNITLLVVRPGTLFSLYSWVAKILLQERLGYSVSLLFTGLAFMELYVPDPMHPIDASVAEYKEPNNPMYNQYVGGGELVDYGNHEEVALNTLWFTANTLGAHPDLALEHWRTYSSVERGGHGDTVIPLFINDSWAGLTGPSGENNLRFNPADPTSEFVCESDENRAKLGQPPAGCVGGMYCPAHCGADPRSKCAVIYSMFPSIASGLIQNVVRNLRLNLCVAWLSNYVSQTLVLPTQGKHLLMYGSSLEAAAFVKCNVALVDKSTVPPTVTYEEQRCWNTLSLPHYDSSCTQLSEGGSYLGDYDCDFISLPVFKVADAKLEATAPRAAHFLKQMALYPADGRRMEATLSAAGGAGTPENLNAAACEWITHNADMWQKWVAPPAECTREHYEFVLHGCDAKTHRQLVSYQWLRPKACQDGVALPPPETQECDAVELQSQDGQMMVGLTVVLALPLLALLAVQTAMSASEASNKRSNGTSGGTGSGGSSSKVTQAHLYKAGSHASVTAAATAALAGPSTLTLIYSRLPMLSLARSYLYPLALGCLLLLALVWAHLGALTSHTCWVRLGLTYCGLQLVGCSLVAAAHRLRQHLSSLLLVDVTAKTHALLWLNAIVNAVLVLVAALVEPDLLESHPIPLAGGALLPNQRCADEPTWLIWSMLAVNVPWMLVLVRSFAALFWQFHLQAWVKWMMRDATADDEFDTVSDPKASRRRGGGSSRPTSGQRGTHKTRVQRMQYFGLCGGLAVWLALAASTLVLARYTRNSDTIHNQSLALWVTVSTLWLAMLLPSFYHAVRMSRRARQQAALARAKGKEAGGQGSGSSQGGDSSGTLQRVTRKRGGGSIGESDTLHTLFAGRFAGRKGAQSVSGGGPGSKSGARASEVGDDDVSGGGSGRHSFVHSFGNTVTLYFLELYAASAFDSENLHFLMATRDLFSRLKAPALTAKQLLHEVAALHDEYLSDGAPQQVNVSGEMVKEANYKFQLLHDQVQTVISAAAAAATAASASLHPPNSSPRLQPTAHALNAAATGTGASRGGASSPVPSPSPSPPPGGVDRPPSKVTFLRTGSASSGPSVLANSAMRGMARAYLSAVVREVLTLVETNTYTRFLTSKYAVRANKLLQWCETFDDLPRREQQAVTLHFQRRMQAEEQREKEMTTVAGGSMLSQQDGGSVAGAPPALTAAATMLSSSPGGAGSVLGGGSSGGAGTNSKRNTVLLHVRTGNPVDQPTASRAGSVAGSLAPMGGGAGSVMGSPSRGPRSSPGGAGRATSYVSPFATPLALINDTDMSPMMFASMAPIQLPASAHRGSSGSGGIAAPGASPGHEDDGDADLVIPSVMRLNTDGGANANHTGGSFPSSPVPGPATPAATNTQPLQQLPGTPQLDPTPHASR